MLQAAILGLGGIGIADRNSVGVVRAHAQAKALRERSSSERSKVCWKREKGLKTCLILSVCNQAPGWFSRMERRIFWPTLKTEKGWAHLAPAERRNLRAEKGNCVLMEEDLMNGATR